MEPFFEIKDKKMFYEYLNNCKIYFEFGSGGSTYQASLKKNIKKIYSVESDKEWYEIVQLNIKSENFKY